MNDRLRIVAVRLLIEAALASVVSVCVQPTVTFVYPSEGYVDEDSPLADVAGVLESALVAEGGTARFRSAGGRGIVLRLGLPDSPGTGNREPNPLFGATPPRCRCGPRAPRRANAPAGTYDVVREGERVSNSRFKEATGWRPIR